MLVPEVAQGAAEDLDDLRAACDAAIQDLLAQDLQHIAVIGAGPDDRFWDRHAGGSFKPYGVDLHVGGPGDELPLSLTVGAWLLERNGWSGSRAYATGGVEPQGRTALLVMADGTAKRTTEAPGYFDERAESFDHSIANALEAGDAAALAALDPALAAELWCGGVVPLTLLGRAIVEQMPKGTSIAANMRYDRAPFGVGYWVATWLFSS